MDMKPNKIIAVDFDGTLCKDDYPEIGEANEDVIAYLKNRKKDGDKLILWTCRSGELLEKAKKWASKHGLEFDAINENLPEIVKSFGGDTRKIFANEYLDDRNISFDICGKKSKKKLWAEQEIELFKKRNPSVDLPENILKFVDIDLISIDIFTNIIKRLANNIPICPIEDDKDEWELIATEPIHRNRDCGCIKCYQSKRMKTFRKVVYPDGTIKYKDLERFSIFVNSITNTPIRNAFIEQILNDLYPISMPYKSASQPYVVFCEALSIKKPHLDFDTVRIVDIYNPCGSYYSHVDRLFKKLIMVMLKYLSIWV